MDARNRAQRRGSPGFTFVEISIAMTILVIVLSALAWAIDGMRGLAESAQERSSLQTAGQAALLEIMSDLSRSGVTTQAVDVDGDLVDVRFPVIYEGGDPGEEFPDHVHAPAVENAAPGEPDFGRDREILFLLPRDADADRRPDLDEDGNLLWGAQVISYVLVTRQDGSNYLERRVDGAAPRIVARFVERVLFEDAANAAYEIPLGSVRVRIFLRKLDAFGHVQRYFTEAVVALKNG
jgi:prepilin-type N-terminal cleavage/methylation domain-containing protein